MRPKKTILLVDGNERRVALRRFILETRKYQVRVAVSVDDAMIALHPAAYPCNPDLVLLSDTILVPNAVIRLAKQKNPETTAILLQDLRKPLDEVSEADAVLCWDPGHAADVLSTIRLLVARKRGPKPRRFGHTPTQSHPLEARSAA